MDHYIEIRLLPDPEFPTPLLMNALFAKLHRGLVGAGNGRIGVSFPEHDNDIPTLGGCLRLHGNRESLQTLMHLNWLAGMRDHTRISEVKPIPTPKGYRMVRRVQAKSSPERLRRRYMKRHDASGETARKVIPDTAAEYLQLPYITVGSQSTGQRFRLFINHDPLAETSTPGTFSHYGLSREATVPWF